MNQAAPTHLRVMLCVPVALAGVLSACSSSESYKPSSSLLDRSQPVAAKRFDAPSDPSLGKVRVRVLAGDAKTQDRFTWTAGRQMINVLGEFPNFTVLDPENLESIRQEWELADAGVTNPSQTPKATGLSVPEYHIICRVTQVEADIEAQRAASQWEVLIPFGVKSEDRVGVLELVTDLVNPVTGETIRSIRTAGMFSRSMRGTNYTIPGVYIVYSESEKKMSRVPEVQAVRIAVEEAAPKLFAVIRETKLGAAR